MIRPSIAILFLLSICLAHGDCQSVAEPKGSPVTLTGIVLASDHRCMETHVADDFCRSSDWALSDGAHTYLLYGDIAAFRTFQRKRARIVGSLAVEQLVSYGVHVMRRKVFVSSIESSEISEGEIERLVSELKVVPWRGPENYCSPMCWNFAFTEPMVRLLQAGHGAQNILLRHIDDREIQDQIVMLLGGVGDENAIAPIIELMADGRKESLDAKSKRQNLIGNLALTNLTVSEVIWHHGGGISPDRCPDVPRSCWSIWWADHRGTFRVGVAGDRLYSNYPNYGVYAQFGDLSTQ